MHNGKRNWKRLGFGTKKEKDNRSSLTYPLCEKERQHNNDGCYSKHGFGITLWQKHSTGSTDTLHLELKARGNNSAGDLKLLEVMRGLENET